ncbi:hypothetical protein ACOMHN_009839 [Nucella lapillus]
MASTLTPNREGLMQKKATQKLYLLLPNHDCPQKDCPFHPPAEEQTMEEEDGVTETLTRLQQIGATVPEGGGLMLPPPRLFHKTDIEEESKDSFSEITIDTREESIASDYESIMTVDSGMGRERDELSDIGDSFLLSLPSDLLRVDPELHFIEEDDDEVKTLTSEPVTLEDVIEQNAEEECVAPVLVHHSELKEGEEIKEDKRHHLSYKEGVATLQILELEPQDEGQYVCEAVNNLGDIDTAAQLQVEEVRHRRKRKEETEAVPHIKVSRQEEEGDVVETMPPEFTLPLVDQVRQVGEDVEFSVTVSSHPEAEVQWLCGDRRVSPSPRHVMHHRRDVYRLTVHDLTPQDAGEWKCVAINPLGTATSSCDLRVLETIPEDHRAPRFPQELEDMTVTHGSKVQLECEVIGFPQPHIQWYKDRRRIESDQHYAVRCDNNLCMLVISSADYDDTGAYMCLAVNDAGSASTEARIRVQSVHDKVTRPERPSEGARLEGAPSSRYRYQVAPDFTAKLKNKRVHEGASVHLNCSVTGIPQPHIRWLKDGQEIFEGPDYTMKNNYGLLSLEVVLARSQHAGVYTCEASNEEGTATCQARLDVEGEEELESMELEFLRPRFLTPLHDIMVDEGEDVTFHCKAVGKPMPHFKWQKDMLELSSSKRVEVTFDDKGGATLTIRKVKMSDAGLYLVLAQSRSGRTKSSATLRIRGKSRSPPSSPEAVEYGRPSYEGGMASLQQMAVPGKPPKFSIMLPAKVDVHEGEKLRLDCSVQGFPTPIVSWHKGYRGLMYGQRHRIMFVGTLHTLEIPQTMSLDSGEYIVRATNAFGCVETSCTVNILPPRQKGEGIVAGEMMQLDATPKIKTGKEAPRRGKAPFFIKHLPRTIEVMEGMNVRLDCILRGGVELVQWSDTDADSAKQRLEGEGFEGDFVPLTFRGERLSSTTSSTARSSDEDGTPPSFKTTLQDLVLPAGSEAVFECVTSGAASSTGSWFKDGKRLAPSNTVTVTSDGNRHRLVIAAIGKSDEGEYTFEMSTYAGSASCSATLTIQASSEEGRASKTQSVESKGRGSSGVPPKSSTQSRQFKRDLPPQTSAIVGDQVTLTCALLDPITEIKWEKDGRQVTLSSNRISCVQQQDGTVFLQLSGLVESDAGVYRCTAVLSDGTVIHTTTQLSLTAPEKSQAVDEDGEVAPVFGKTLKDQRVKDGDTILLTCSVKGRPRPQVTWTRHGEEILDNQDILISTIGGDCKLQILDVYPEDEGPYACTANNSAGEATTSCFITVEDAYMSGDSEASSSYSYGKRLLWH